MADVRNYFGAAILVALLVFFTATLYTESMANGGYTDTGEYPLAGQSSVYMTDIKNKTTSLTNSMNATFGQSQSVDLATGFLASAAAAGTSMSVMWSLFMMVYSVTTTMFMSTLSGALGVPVEIIGLGLAYIIGLITLIIAGVVLKWFI